MHVHSCDDVAGKTAVRAAPKHNAIVFCVGEPIHEIARVPVEIVSAHHHMRRILHQQIMLEPFPKCVARNSHAACVANLNIHLNVAKNIVPDGDITFLRERPALTPLQGWVQPASLDSDVSGIGRFARVLDGASGDRNFADRAAG